MPELPLDNTVRFGLTSRLPTRAIVRETTAILERHDFNSIWVGDHIAFTSPILDPLLQLTQAAAYSDTLTVGTCVYLMPLRPPAPVAKMTASLDHLSEGRFVFGVGVGGEFPGEFEACGVPHNERGARLAEGVEVVRKLWTGKPVSHSGRFLSFSDVQMQPATYTPGGPPIWCGGRSEAALRRIGRMMDGWVSYVVTPAQYEKGLATIAESAAKAKRTLEHFGTAHLLFMRIDDSRDKALNDAAELLSRRYAMDFRKPAERYAALGDPAAIAERLRAFYAAGVRHFIFDMLGTVEERNAQLERFVREVRPLISDIC